MGAAFLTVALSCYLVLAIHIDIAGVASLPGPQEVKILKAIKDLRKCNFKHKSTFMFDFHFSKGLGLVVRKPTSCRF